MSGKVHHGRRGVFVAKKSRAQMHACAVPGCGCRIRLTLLMCPAHWQQVPKDLQEAVSAAYDDYKYWPGNSDVALRYSAARRAAIQAVSQQKETSDVKL